MPVLKALLVTLFAFVPSFVFAEMTAFSQFSAWMNRIVSPNLGTTVTLRGTSTEDIPCELYVTRKSDGNFYLSLGVGEFIENDPGNKNNWYFGSSVRPEDELQVSDRTIQLWHNGRYAEGGEIYDNISVDVKVNLDENQTPIRASGQSTLQPERQICLLREPVIS